MRYHVDMAKVQMTTQLEPVLAEKVKRFAAEHQWSTSEAIRRLVEKGLEEAEGDE